MSDNYEVGYGKPPKHKQFPKGVSGNPMGRPRGPKNMLTEMLDELSRPMRTPDGKKISKARTLARSLFAEALKGKIQAHKLLLQLIRELAEVAVQEREHDSVKRARMLQKMILETFAPTEDEKTQVTEEEETPELRH